MGARVRVVAPPTLLPSGIERFGVEVHHDMERGLAGCDIVMMLRLQTERMQGSYVPSIREYFRYYRSEEHTSELQSLMRISYAVFCFKKKTTRLRHTSHNI